MTIEEQIAHLKRATTEIISEADLAAKLKKGRPLRVKLGVDPTANSVTLGWAVVLRKLRAFQQLGHQAVLIVGDFTAQIGDPSGKSKTRKQLSKDEVMANVEQVKGQFGRILDIENTEIRYNSEWLGPMGFDDVIRLASRMTVARILERDDFANRLQDGKPVSLHEVLYPLCQGYDSVAIKADVELGGNDQKFNNLVGRTLMAQYELEPQVVVLSPLLVGTDGVEKMGQSLGNYIGIEEVPNEMYGKAMSIPDSIIANYFELATEVPLADIPKIIASYENPRDAKRHLARELVTLYHGAGEAKAADEYFLNTFSRRQSPVDAPEVRLPDGLADTDGKFGVVALLVALEMAGSNGEAKRLIASGAVSLNGEKVNEVSLRLSGDELVGKILKCGKHSFVKISG